MSTSLQATAPSDDLQPLSVTANVATYRGCPVFTAGGYYNQPAANTPVDPQSSEYINAGIGAGNNGGFGASIGYERVNLATSGTPMVVVHPQVSYHPFPDRYPWKGSFYIEHLSDAHAMVVQTSDCHLYEAWHADWDNSLSAYSGANWNMRGPFVPLAPGSPSAMASGLSLFAGMVRWDDVQRGSIDHALDWSAPEGTAAQWKFVRPASDTDGVPFRGSSRDPMPYGAHLRLRSSYDSSGFGPQARLVANALKTYGMYLADTGSSNTLYFANADDGSDPWNADDLRALSRIKLSDFEVVRLPVVQNVPGH